MAKVSRLTDRNAVLAALSEFDAMGRDAFLERYGFGYAKRWQILYNGRHYDSKAVLGAAIGLQFGTALRSNEFTGGEHSVVRKLRSLGFQVIAVEITDETSRLPEEVTETFPEGMRSIVLVNKAERNAAARARCIELHGVSCKICGIDFETLYGAEFSGLIHVHHLQPLSGQTEVGQVNPATDLAPVCPNCHAAIHFGGGNRSLDDMRAHLGLPRVDAL